jgi:hypothetical protein
MTLGFVASKWWAAEHRLLSLRWIAVQLLTDLAQVMPVIAYEQALALPLRTLRRKLLSVRWVAPILLHQALAVMPKVQALMLCFAWPDWPEIGLWSPGRLEAGL